MKILVKLFSITLALLLIRSVGLAHTPLSLCEESMEFSPEKSYQMLAYLRGTVSSESQSTEESRSLIWLYQHLGKKILEDIPEEEKQSYIQTQENIAAVFYETYVKLGVSLIKNAKKKESPDDLPTDIFLTILRCLKGFDLTRTYVDEVTGKPVFILFGTYFGTAIDKSINHAHSKKNLQHRFDDAIQNIGEDKNESYANYSQDRAASHSDKEFSPELETILKKILTAKEFDIIHLFYIKGLTFQDIAKQYSITKSNLQERYNLILRKLNMSLPPHFKKQLEE